MAVDGLRIEIAGAERADEVRALWLSLHHHHRRVATLQPLVDDDEASWQRRRALYQASLAADRGFLAIATKDRQPVAYAMVVLERGPDDTWPVADRYAELYSLCVAEDERGRGLGGAMFEAVERELADRGIFDLKVAVMSGNTEAVRFYERRGLQTGELLLYRFGPRA